MRVAFKLRYEHEVIFNIECFMNNMMPIHYNVKGILLFKRQFGIYFEYITGI